MWGILGIDGFLDSKHKLLRQTRRLQILLLEEKLRREAAEKAKKLDDKIKEQLLESSNEHL